MFKPIALFAGCCALWVGFLGLPPAAAQNTAPPVASFFQAPAFSAAALSPDGTLLAIRLAGTDGRDRLAVLDLATQKVQPVASFSDADIDQFRWVNGARLVFTLADRRGLREDTHAAPGLYAVNADGSGFRQLVQREKAWSRDKSGTSQLMERERVYVPDNTGTNQPVDRERVIGRDGIASTQLPFGTRLFDQSGSQNDHFVFVLLPDGPGGPDEPQPTFFKLARLNTVSGRAEDVDAPLNAVQWLLDGQGELRAVLTTKDKTAGQKTLTLHTREPGAGTWRAFDAGGGNGLLLRAVAPDGTLYVTARPGRDTEAVFSLNARTGQLADKPLLGTPPYDLTPEFISADKSLLGLRFTVDAETTQWFDGALKAEQADIDKLLPNTANMLSPPRRGSSPWRLVRAFADVQPPVFHLFNAQSKRLTRLGAEQPSVAAAAMSPMDLVRFKARDGAEIPAYLTLPVSAAKKTGLRLVIWAHDGPAQRGSTWGWQAGVQFLASRGYAVIQPALRGSLGFGQRHAAAAFTSNDLTDAARWAVAQGVADPQRICVLGAGFGGYAALQALSQSEKEFRCGVAWAVTHEPTAAGQVLPALVAAIRIPQPLLMAHGRLDRITPFSQAQSLAASLKPPNASLQWIPYEKEGHGWSAPETTVDWWTQVEVFLARQLTAAKP